MHSDKKKLMILGAGPSQLPAIKKAVELGFYVITVDYLPENIGHTLSHHFVNCSTVDQDGVLHAAKELAIDGIMTFASDVATPTVGYVAEQLGLAGGHSSVALIMSNKSRFRTFQKKQGLNCPNFVIGQDFETIRNQLTQLTPPVIMKPVDSSGSRGISTVDDLNSEHCFQAFHYAHEYSHSGQVCIEEFVEGFDTSGDGFLINGKLFAVITHKHKQGLIPRGHRLPTTLSVEDQQRVKHEVSVHCCALEYSDGPLDFDVRVSKDNVTILEMSPRLGGNGIPMLIEHGSGVDLIATTIQFVVGESVELPEEIAITRGCGSWILGSEHTGLLKDIASKEAMVSAIPEIFEYVLYSNIGSKVSEFVHSANSLGYVLFDCDSEAHYLKTVEGIQNILNLHVSQ
ncbi:putative carbamoyl-phosphate-synthetase [Candidatus Vecturithrix granuli]|uniref:Putative carbamoyl-phosphate-synthetase n=1 Tax=Vecturithrix granuli TaxID=1499967 RepID=A0A081BX25_VECG1|nr:putative carbamoyl-phosphate-synthetase [Candidatus Vecturithrix granuli]